jgi:hypothetical protein
MAQSNDDKLRILAAHDSSDAPPFIKFNIHIIKTCHSFPSRASVIINSLAA